jgi:hypothetical protein
MGERDGKDQDRSDPEPCEHEEVVRDAHRVIPRETKRRGGAAEKRGDHGEGDEECKRAEQMREPGSKTRRSILSHARPLAEGTHRNRERGQQGGDKRRQTRSEVVLEEGGAEAEAEGPERNRGPRDERETDSEAACECSIHKVRNQPGKACWLPGESTTDTPDLKDRAEDQRLTHYMGRCLTNLIGT